MAQETVTKRDLAKAVAGKHGLTQLEAMAIIQTALDQIVKELSDGNRLEFRNFGVFEPRLRRGRAARNPRTNEPLYAEPKATVTFKTGKKMRQAIQKAMPLLK